MLSSETQKEKKKKTKKKGKKSPGPHALLICPYDLKPFKDWSHSGIREFFSVIRSGFVGLKSWVGFFLNSGFLLLLLLFFFLQAWHFLWDENAERLLLEVKPRSWSRAGSIGSSGGRTLGDPSTWSPRAAAPASARPAVLAGTAASLTRANLLASVWKNQCK